METAHLFKKQKVKNILDKGAISCSAPSNIALVKYWGKFPVQLPANPSISFTLQQSKTITILGFQQKNQEIDEFEFDLLFEGAPKPEFIPKLEAFFQRIAPYFDFLTRYRFTINTKNTFPHSSGIASSASSMSALAYCLVRMEAVLSNNSDENFIKKKTSFIARLGSGSACRSIDGPVMVWGKHAQINSSNDLFAVKFPHKIHPNFIAYQDTILLVDRGKKEVSSSVGHDLMHQHPYAKNRFGQAQDNCGLLKDILISGDLKRFVTLVESEALTLHAMMMTSLPYFMLMKPTTLEIIQKVWEYRKQYHSALCFTLDAGANVHLLYPENEKDTIKKFIENELVAYCENGKYICDEIGFGIELL